MATLPDPPEYEELANVPDAVGKFRSIGGWLILDGKNYCADADTDAGGKALSRDLRGVEQDTIAGRLATLRRLEEIYNQALQCAYMNILPTTKPKSKCKPVVVFSVDDGSIESFDTRR